ncbi:MAG: NADH-quinone oxidoreductase subunit J [Planctomycetia bacterium]|nr:NADH-quinone oxidoreductase subunit J [Planctomycetia bacterium]
MTLNDFIFWCLALFTGGSALATLVSSQLVRSAVWLLFTLAGVAGLYFQLGFEFLGATQLLIYVGGILVLIVFAIMLTAQGPQVKWLIPKWQWLLTACIAGGLFVLLIISLSSVDWSSYQPTSVKSPTDASNTDRLSLTLLGSTQGEQPQPLPAVPTQNRQIVHNLLVFEIISVHLLVVLIGAAYLARSKRLRRDVA